jgi:hypothetical protein
MPLIPPLPPDSMPVDTAAQLAAHTDGHGHFEALREYSHTFPLRCRRSILSTT